MSGERPDWMSDEQAALIDAAADAMGMMAIEIAAIILNGGGPDELIEAGHHLLGDGRPAEAIVMTVALMQRLHRDAVRLDVDLATALRLFAEAKAMLR